MTPPSPLPLTAEVEDIEELTFATLGFADRERWLAWRLSVIGIPTRVGMHGMHVACGTLSVTRLPERGVTAYTWTPPA